MSAETKFAEAVEKLTDGNRHGRPLNRAAALARLAGMGESQFVNYVMENAPGDRRPDRCDVVASYRYAANGNETKGIPGIPLGGDCNFRTIRCAYSPATLSPTEAAERRRRLLPKAARQFVSATLRNYATTAFTGHITADAFAETIRMSEEEYIKAAGPDIYPKQAARQLRALFRPGDKIWAGTIIPDEADRIRLGYRYAKTPIRPAPGDDLFDPAVRAGIIEAHLLADRIETGVVATIPTHIALQPVTGETAQTSGSSPSFDCAATVSAWRHVLIEWDSLFDLDADGAKMPSQSHIETVAGLIDYAFEHPDIIRVVSATWTGGKSIHVALRVKADDRAAYKTQTAALRDLFASADDKIFRVDTTGWDNGYTHIRLAGAIRPETGRRARLLWANP